MPGVLQARLLDRGHPDGGGRAPGHERGPREALLGLEPDPGRHPAPGGRFRRTPSLRYLFTLVHRSCTYILCQFIM